jgi:hypothetical protein
MEAKCLFIIIRRVFEVIGLQSVKPSDVNGKYQVVKYTYVKDVFKKRPNFC